MIDRNGTRDAPHIMVVEDEPLVRMSAVMAFENMGCTVVEAATADEALDLLERRSGIKAVFTDIEMPGKLDGLELAQLVRRKWPEIYVVIGSGRILPPKSSLPEGVRFIAKPYYPPDLEHIAKVSGCVN